MPPSIPRTRSGASNGHRRVVAPPPGPADTIIVISSDESEVENSRPLPPKKRSLPRRPSKQRGKTKAKSPDHSHADPIEVSSEDEEQKRRRSSRTVAEMERQLQKLKEENQQLKRQQLESSSKSQNVPQDDGLKTKHEDLVDTLDEIVSCDICTGKMWTPATLRCGHTFCQPCLQDWFSTALMKHLSIHPNYTMHTARMLQIMHVLRRGNLQPAQHRILELEALAELEKQAQPEYTCPTCRIRVLSRPVEVFALKAGVRTVANVMSEEEPQSARQTARGKDDGPWDGFLLNLDA